ncbi:MAG TPA: phosphatidate cytidylyltransferase [Nitrospira sp.]|nr:phosphatidate cytidylyltransferase [Nitrospira sp.]
MLECGTTNPEPAQTVRKTTARFDSRRIYTVLILAPLLYAAVRFLPPSAFTALVAVAGCLALYELYRLCFPPPPQPLAVGIGLSGCTLLVVGPHEPTMLVPGLLAALVAILSLPLLGKVSLADSLKNGAITLTGMLYIGLTLSYLVMTRLLPQGEWLIFFLLLVTWAGDAGAYYMGTVCGQHALAPGISPKKTVEGLAGGLIGALIIAFAARWWFLPALSVLDGVILAVLLTITGLWGDLAESAIKRSVGAKDSGGVLPGHGGMLDRLDSLLFTAPAFYYYVTVISRFSEPA